LPHSSSRIAFSPDRKTLATATADGAVRLWNVATGEEIVQFDTAAEKIIKLQFSQDSRQLAAVVISNEASEPSDSADGTNPVARLFLWSGAGDW
jgi:WD40 repeat protein